MLRYGWRAGEGFSVQACLSPIGGMPTPMELHGDFAAGGITLRIDGPEGLIASASGLSCVVESGVVSDQGQQWVWAGEDREPFVFVVPVPEAALATGQTWRAVNRDAGLGVTLTLTVEDENIARYRGLNGLDDVAAGAVISLNWPRHCAD
jgi:hypothetical protein